MKVRRSRLDVLRILAHAENHGTDATCERYGVDPRTLARWLEKDPPGWHRDSEMARLAANEKYYSGGAMSVVQARTDAGINARNDRYEQLIARREARRSDGTCDCVLPPGWRADMHPKAGTPEHEQAVWQIALAKMPNARRVFMDAVRPLLAFYIDFHDDGGRWPDVPEARQLTNAALEGLPAPAADEDAMGVLIRWIEGLDDETLAARQTLADDALKAWRDAIIDELEERAYDAGAAEHAAEADARRATPPETPQEAPEPSAPAPTPIRRARKAPEPTPMVLDVGAEDHDRGWQPLERRDAPW